MESIGHSNTPHKPGTGKIDGKPFANVPGEALNAILEQSGNFSLNGSA